MDNRHDIRDFLMSRRARIKPESSGLPIINGQRRVKGLRREEVALLAGVSVDYYIRLERGNLAGASSSVLEAISRALQLNDIEKSHLYVLANQSPYLYSGCSSPFPQNIRPVVQQILDGFIGAAVARNNRLDILGLNATAKAMYSPLIGDTSGSINIARFIFLDPIAQDFYPDWDKIAGDTVAILRESAGRHPSDKILSDLIKELSTQSHIFKNLWSEHNVHTSRSGMKRILHPTVGEVELFFEALELTADMGVVVIFYTSEPGSLSSHALSLLSSCHCNTTTQKA